MAAHGWRLVNGRVANEGGRQGGGWMTVGQSGCSKSGGASWRCKASGGSMGVYQIKGGVMAGEGWRWVSVGVANQGRRHGGSWSAVGQW